MVVDMRPWSSNLGLQLIVAHPFFCLKISHFKATVGPYSRASINVKTGSPDPADFAKTQRLLS
jgi:hypothetical protein